MTVEWVDRQEKREMGYVRWKECTKRQGKKKTGRFKGMDGFNTEQSSTLTVYEAK